MKRRIAFRAKRPQLAKHRARSCPKFVVMATLLALWFTTPISGVAQITFGNPTNYPVGTQPGAVATGDFNHDGNLDLAVDNAASNNISILLGNGDGTFQTTMNYAVVLQDPVSIAVVDLNLDNKLDLVVAFHGNQSTAQTGGLSLLLGNGDGTFEPATTIASSDYPTGVATGDFNNDNRPDLAVLNINIDGPVSVFLGNGDGTFHSAVNYSVTGFPTSVVVGDFNGDNKQDLAVTTDFGIGSEGLNGNASVLLGNGDGSFKPAVETSLGGAAWSGAVGDFNGDQKLDLAFIIKPTSVFGVVGEAIALGNGDGTFGSLQNVGGADFATSVMVNDLNEDGAPDVVGFSYPVTHALHIFLGLGDGTFHQPQTLVFSSGPGGTAIGDFNGDSLADLAVTMLGQNVVSIFLNTTTDFTLSLSALALPTVSPGQSDTSTVTTTAANGFTGSVSFTCSVQPTPALAPQCSVNPTAVNPGTTATLAITTTGPRSALAFPSGRYGLLYAVWLPVCGLMLVGVGFGSPQAKKRKFLCLVHCVVFTGLIFQAACGGGGSGSGGDGSGGTPAGNYSITITGTSGSTQHSTTTKFTVNK